MIPRGRIDHLIMASTAFFLLVLFVQGAISVRPCCNGENRMVNKRCVNGEPFTALACPQKYVPHPDDVSMVDENDRLVIATSHIPPDEYCSTMMNNTLSYIVCFSMTPEQSLMETMYVVSAVFELISIFFLLVTIAVYLSVPDLLDLQGICILHSISGLVVSFLVLASNQLTSRSVEWGLCVSYAYIMYFSMLYAFFWLNVLSFHIWRTVAKPKLLKSQKYWVILYHVIGIGGPTIFLIMLGIASSMKYSEIHPGFGETKCWFKSTKTQFIYFYGPMAMLLCLNIIYYGWTIAILWRNLTKCDEKKAKVLKYRLLLCVKLFFVMGISWIFELTSAASNNVHYALRILWCITDVLNTLQGILIFLILVVFRKRVIRGLANRSFCGLRLPSRWRTVADDECEEIEEEFSLSEAQVQKN